MGVVAKPKYATFTIDEVDGDKGSGDQRIEIVCPHGTRWKIRLVTLARLVRMFFENEHRLFPMAARQLGGAMTLMFLIAYCYTARDKLGQLVKAFKL